VTDQREKGFSEKKMEESIPKNGKKRDLIKF